ncbi:hypothetical protein ACHAPT_001145 [Fusarium lateritium]
MLAMLVIPSKARGFKAKPLTPLGQQLIWIAANLHGSSIVRDAQGRRIAFKTSGNRHHIQVVTADGPFGQASSFPGNRTQLSEALRLWVTELADVLSPSVSEASEM